MKVRVGIPLTGGRLVAAAREQGYAVLFSANAFARTYPKGCGVHAHLCSGPLAPAPTGCSVELEAVSGKGRLHMIHRLACER